MKIHTVKIGRGTAIHAARSRQATQRIGKTEHTYEVYETLCGQEGRGNGQVRFKTQPMSKANGPVTCPKCLALMKQYGISIDDDELDWHWASEDELSRTRYGEERTEAIAQAHLDAYAEYYG